MCSYVGASCALPLALEASGQAVARCVTKPRCSRGFNHEWLRCWQMSHAFLCSLPSVLRGSCASLHSSWHLPGKLVYVRHTPSMPAKFCLSSDIGRPNLKMRDSLRRKKSAEHVQNDDICQHARWQDAIYRGSFTGIKTGTSGIAGIRLLMQTSLTSCGFLDFTPNILSQLGSCNRQWFVIWNFLGFFLQGTKHAKGDQRMVCHVLTTRLLTKLHQEYAALIFNKELRTYLRFSVCTY